MLIHPAALGLLNYRGHRHHGFLFLQHVWADDSTIFLEALIAVEITFLNATFYKRRCSTSRILNGRWRHSRLVTLALDSRIDKSEFRVNQSRKVFLYSVSLAFNNSLNCCPVQPSITHESLALASFYFLSVKLCLFNIKFVSLMKCLHSISVCTQFFFGVY